MNRLSLDMRSCVFLAGVISVLCVCEEPASSEQKQPIEADPLPVRLTIDQQPIPGGGSVDAVTQATSMVSTLRLQIDPPRDSTDSIEDVVVTFGDAVDSTNTKEWLGGTYPEDKVGGTQIINHWYLRTGPETMCTTSVRATTYGGQAGADTVVVRVISLTGGM